MPWDEGLVNSLVYESPDPVSGREKWPHPFEQQSKFLKWTLC